jgi:adenosylmethionine-8-amino-7-oxononanoate aminotransferase
VLAEPVGGSSTGASVPAPEYWRRVRAACDRHGVLLVADEVLTGAGRTGTWSALEPYGVVPDIMALGKGIAGGYVPLSAVVAPRRLVDVLARGSGALLHAQTFSHHATLCAAGVASLRYLREHGLIERCAAVAPAFHARLAALRQLPGVGDVRGRGLLAGVEFVADAATRAPFPRAAHFAETFAAAALEAGLVVWPNVGQADGVNGDIAMLAPPFIVTEDEIDLIVQRFGVAVRATVERIGAVA